jgi:hypothetical protein
MLDVHPAHHAANTWREFFTHIATIVLGLCIAVGLEQTVEHFHNRHLVAETREALRREHDLNVKRYAIKAQEFRRMTPVLQTDLAIFLYLQKHPGAPAQDLPGKLHWFNLNIYEIDTAWKTAQQDNVLVLMPGDEVQRDAQLYRIMEAITDHVNAFKAALYDARRFTITDPDPSHLTPEQVTRQVDLVNQLLLQHVLEGANQINLHTVFPEFDAPTNDDLAQITHITSDEEENDALNDLKRKLRQVMGSEVH